LPSRPYPSTLKFPYAASLLGNLKHWLEDDPEIAELVKIVPFLNREELCCK
jgi:ArsR family transcriptional regulator